MRRVSMRLFTVAIPIAVGLMMMSACRVQEVNEPSSEGGMTKEEMIAVIDRYHDLLDEEDWDALESLFTEDFIAHSEQSGDIDGTRDTLMRILKIWRAAFTDLEWYVDDALVEGDKLVLQGWHAARHVGEWRGTVATGKRVDCAYIDIYRFEDGRISEYWGVSNALRWFTILGAIPPIPDPF
jgi:predicted ester cyclase